MPIIGKQLAVIFFLIYRASLIVKNRWLFGKVGSYHDVHNSIIKNGAHRARFLSYKRLKLVLKVFWTGFLVAMATDSTKKFTLTGLLTV